MVPILSRVNGTHLYEPWADKLATPICKSSWVKVEKDMCVRGKVLGVDVAFEREAVMGIDVSGFGEHRERNTGSFNEKS